MYYRYLRRLLWDPTVTILSAAGLNEDDDEDENDKAVFVALRLFNFSATLHNFS